MSERNIQKRRQPEEKHQPKTGVSPKEKPLPNTVVQGKYQPKTGVSPKEKPLLNTVVQGKYQPKTGVSPKEKPLSNTVVQRKYQPKTGVSPKERTKGTGCFVLDKAAKLTYLENEGDRLFRSLLLGADAVRVALFLELP